MKPDDVRLWMLQSRLTLARFGWLNSAAIGLILLGLAAWWWGIAYMQQQAAAPLHSLEQARLSLQAPDSTAGNIRTLPEQRLAAFHDVLGERRYAEQQVRTLFAIAGKAGLVLNRAEYKAAFDKNSRTHTYQVMLPIKGTYESIRQFCEQMLLAIPFASLDEISFKREAIGSRTLEAKLRFTLYLAGDKP